MASCCSHGAEPSAPIKGGEILNHLSDSSRFKDDCSARSSVLGVLCTLRE